MRLFSESINNSVCTQKKKLDSKFFSANGLGLISKNDDFFFHMYFKIYKVHGTDLGNMDSYKERSLF